MLFIKFILLLLSIWKVYSSAHNHNAEQLAVLILSVADNDGNLLTNNIFDPNGSNNNLEKFSFSLDPNNNNNIIGNNLLDLGNGKTIIDIIPTLGIDYITKILKYEHQSDTNYSPSPNEIRGKLISEFKELYMLSLKVINEKYSDSYIDAEIELKQKSELKNAKNLFEERVNSNNEILNSINNNIKNVLNDDSELNKLLPDNIKQCLTENINKNDELEKKIDNILKNSDGNEGEYKKEIFNVKEQEFRKIYDALNAKKGPFKTFAGNLKDFIVPFDDSEENRIKIYNKLIEALNGKNNRLKNGLISILEENITTISFDGYFKTSDGNYSLDNAKQTGNNLIKKLKENKIDKQINLYNNIKSENEDIKTKVKIDYHKYDRNNYNQVQASIKGVQDDIKVNYDNDIRNDLISNKNIKEYYNIMDEELVKKLNNKFSEKNITMKEVNEISSGYDENRINDRNNFLSDNSIATKVIETRSIFSKIYRNEDSGDGGPNLDNQDYLDLIQGNYKVFTDNKIVLLNPRSGIPLYTLQTGYSISNIINDKDTRYISFYNAIRFFKEQYSNNNSYPTQISNLVNPPSSILFPASSTSSIFNSNDQAVLSDYIDNNENHNRIDVHYINLMLKIAKEFYENPSLNINNYKSIDIVQSNSGIYHIVGVNNDDVSNINRNYVEEIFRFKQDSNNNFITIKLGDRKPFNCNSIIDNSYNKETIGNERVQPGIALLAKAGSTFIDTNGINIYEPETYVVSPTANDDKVNFYIYDSSNNEIIRKCFICQDKVKSDIIGKRMIQKSNQRYPLANGLTQDNYLAVKCNYYDNSLPSFGKYIDNAYNIRNIKISNIGSDVSDKIDNNRIKNAMEVIRPEYIQPLNHRNEFEGYIGDMGHSQEYKNMYQYNINSSDNLKCTISINPVRKRSIGSCSKNGSSIVMHEDSDLNVRDILSHLSKISEANELYFEIKEQIENGDINYNVEKVWNKIIEIYENNNNEFDLNEKKNILSLIQNTINIYVDELSTNESYGKSKFISKNFIEKLKNKINHYYSIYEKEKEKEISNNNNNNNNNNANADVDVDGIDVDNEIYEADYKQNTNSIYYKEKLIESIDNLYSLINYNNDDINIGILFNTGNDGIIDDDRLDEINNLCYDIENMIINEEDKEEYKKKLLQIYNDIVKINNINVVDYYYTGEPNNNFEITNKLSKSLVNKLKEEFPDDNKIQKLYHNDIGNIQSINNINLDHIKNLNNNDFIEYISDDTNSKYYIKYFIDNLKLKILIMDEDTNTLDSDIFNDIKSIEKKIKTKIEKIKKYDSDEGHFEEIDHFLQLLNNYNELVTVAISENKISVTTYDNDFISTIELDDEIKNRINYIRTKKLIKGLNNIIKENPDKFNIKPDEDIKNYINTSGKNSIKYTWGNLEIFEPTLSDLNSINKNSFETKAEAMNSIVNDNSGNTDLSDIKKSYKLKTKLVKHQSPMDRDTDDIDEIYSVSERLNDINDSYENIETYQEYNYRSFMKFLSTAAKFDDYVDIENVRFKNDGSLDISSIYKEENINTYDDLFSNMSGYIDVMNEENLLSDEDKNFINKATLELKKYINGCKYKLSESVGRVNSISFNEALEEFNEISSASEAYFDSNNIVNNDNQNKVEINLNSKRNTNQIKNINIKLSKKNDMKRKISCKLSKLKKYRKRKMV